MKKVMFVFGIVFFALNSHAVADVAKSSKGAAHCALNTADNLLKIQSETSAKKKESDIAK